MFKNKLKGVVYIVVLLLTFLSHGQQDPQYTQYMYNMSIINPAYATDDYENINLGALYRAQWVGSEGGPTTGTLFAHSPIAKKVEMGLSIIHDEIGGVVKESNVFVDFAYVLKLSETKKLSFGIKGGATFFSTNFNGFVYSDDLPDPAFAENLSRVFPNIGVGTFYFGENYYLGLSSPNLLQTKHLERQDGVVATGVEEIHYFFTGGYVFNLNDKLKFKPAFMTKLIEGSPLQVDVSANFMLIDKVTVGLAYRWSAAMSAMVGFQVSDAFYVGYSYDFETTTLNNYNSGSHELFLRYELFHKNNKIVTPRFF